MKLFEMGSNLDGDTYDTSKEAKKKNSNKSSSYKIEAKNQHQLVFTYEKRKGKPVTLLGRFYLIEKEKKEVLKLLKKKLACGGAIKDEWIELQGDVKDKVKVILLKEGWKFK
ncbi:translation initiation factor SUI1 [Arcobacter sp. 31_11_sub10_T18]|nr:translation initiation factor SUI1 [Arcobacter sp. 31_11_sub10_T18]